MFWGTVVYAIFNSAVLAVMALGFSLTFGFSGVANFAYGAIYILSAYLDWTFLHFLPFPYGIDIFVSICVSMALGALMYRFVLLRVRGQILSEVIATFGIGLATLELFQYLGLVGYEYTLPVLINKQPHYRQCRGGHAANPDNGRGYIAFDWSMGFHAPYPRRPGISRHCPG